jgi:hypothetical protein
VAEATRVLVQMVVVMVLVSGGIVDAGPDIEFMIAVLELDITVDDIGDSTAGAAVLEEVCTGSTTAEDCAALVGATELELAAGEALLEVGEDDEGGALPAWLDPLG